MKKVFFIFGFVALATGLASCDCNCYKEPNGSATVCKAEYEAAWGAGTWASEGAPAYRNAGWSCQN